MMESLVRQDLLATPTSVGFLSRDRDIHDARQVQVSFTL